MSSVRGGDQSSKWKNVSEVNSPKVDHLNNKMADINLNSEQDDGQWEVARKPKNRAGSSAAKQMGSQSSNNSRAWGNPNMGQKQWMRGNGAPGRASVNSWSTQTADSKRPAGRGQPRHQASTRGFEGNHVPPQPAIGPPLEHGWNWPAISVSTQSKGLEDGQLKDETILNSRHDNDVEADKDDNVDEAEDDDSDVMEDTDEDMSDDDDSDASQKSHNTRKKSRWFKKFFEILDSLSVDDINDPARQWHCPACQGGPGAIDWYRGLQPLMTHAKTKGANRMKIHRELAELLEEELRVRGTSVIPAGEAFGKWKGLKVDEKDHEIIWPPMVVIMNTRLEQDENEKWVGMGNQELLDYFSSYAAIKARHSYGPQGHRGMSVLIFEASARGYLEAERLHKHFAEQGTDRDAWEHRRTRVLFYQGGKRQLYGYMAVKEDLDTFNYHSQGKSKLKYEIRSYQEMVVNQIRQMSEDNQQLIYLKNKVVKEKSYSKAIEECLGITSERLRKTQEEMRIVKHRTKLQHEENKEEMYLQEQFFKDQIKTIHESREAKEEDFEKLQQEERDKVKQLNENPSNADEYKLRVEEIEKYIKLQDREMEDFAEERDKLIKVHEEKMAAMKRRHWEEEVELEKEFNAELTQLMDKYTPPQRPDDSTTNSF
ncbi:hypothetical protein F2P56_013724 [Juglans regia]|uniref:Protein SUPPRESSOR OF GENE SILENCING 3 n=4 Tax=Juglans regia TaxID=51240 RepID=A0A2I4DPU8_JUGRE|nr:protein SUPPRESSOR OF GENE SILENCING 3 [Juglans regia]XP_018809175.1 protein SUPPRESSOR OF GENE SILENCING 3 [Juglans regia]XP_035546838.1 protein SUPPRESSOR OF GENE SILENCING 3-like [Juglans regia]XP_035546839.1 protein SUPPRESSOR OF GENE SILENCING 3-like [Juglans regia]KAF5469669.1 hypothetical protein F2P56_013724 [Juglans regia]